LLRAGRFDRQVLVDRPDRKGRLDILNVHVRKVTLAPDTDLDAIAGATTGFTGADIANLVNEAAIIATRRNASTVATGDFLQAIERIVAGLEKKSRVLNKQERRRVAYHEMGHALVAASLPGVDPILKVSIIPRGVGALGYTMQRPTEDRFLMARSDLENRIAVLAGGRAAESLIFEGDVSTGAADDLQRATEVALEMVTRHGMDDIVGQRTYALAPHNFLATTSGDRLQASEATTREIDLAVRDIVAHAFSRATDILRSRGADLEAGAELLLSRESLTADDFAALRPTPAGPGRHEAAPQTTHSASAAA
jgi:cell division protease FtsH